MTGSSRPTPRILKLLHDLGNIGHPKNPFVNAVYGHGVPCTDFTAFIERCLAEHDTESIIQLAETIAEDSPVILRHVPRELHIPGLRPRPLKTEWGSLRGVKHPLNPHVKKLYAWDGRRRRQGSSLFLGSIRRPVWLAEHSPPPPSSLRQRINTVLSIDFSKYVSFVDPRGFDRLRAMFVRARPAMEYRVEDAVPRLMSWSLAAFFPRWQDGFAPLAERANQLIREQLPTPPYAQRGRQDFGEPDWIEVLDFPSVSSVQFPDPPIAIAQSVRELSAGASMQLVYALKRGGGVLPDQTEYAIRMWGIHVPATCEEILASGLLQITSNPMVILRHAEKSRLAEACDRAGVAYKRRWRKEEIVQALAESAPAQLRLLAKEFQHEHPIVVELPPHLADDLKAFLAYASSLELHFYALSLAVTPR